MAESIYSAAEFTAVSEWDLTGKHYVGVVMGGADNTVQVASVAGVRILGVAQNKVGSGVAVRVRTHGITKAVAGAAITRGAKVDVGATGYFRTAVDSAYAGIALTTVVASGVFKLLLNPHYTTA